VAIIREETPDLRQLNALGALGNFINTSDEWSAIVNEPGLLEVVLKLIQTGTSEKSIKAMHVVQRLAEVGDDEFRCQLIKKYGVVTQLAHVFSEGEKDQLLGAVETLRVLASRHSENKALMIKADVVGLLQDVMKAAESELKKKTQNMLRMIQAKGGADAAEKPEAGQGGVREGSGTRNKRRRLS